MILKIVFYIVSIGFLILSIITIIKRKPRKNKWKIATNMFLIVAILEMTISLIFRDEASNTGTVLLFCCTLFEIMQSVFDKKKNNNKLLLILNVLTCISCTAVIILSIKEK